MRAVPGPSLLSRLANRSRDARVAAWFRRGWDAELLAVAPAKDEMGAPLVWDFPHPVNRSPLCRVLRPWYLFPLLFVAFIACSAMLIRGRLLTPPELGERLLVGAAVGALVAPSIRRRLKPRVERMALRAYRRLRWRAVAAQDAVIAEALERERTPKRHGTPAPAADGR